MNLHFCTPSKFNLRYNHKYFQSFLCHFIHLRSNRYPELSTTLDSFYHFSEHNHRGSVTLQCWIFCECMHLHHIRRFRHGHDQEEFDENYLKYVLFHDISRILGRKLSHIFQARSDPQVDNHQNFQHYFPVLGT